MKSLVVYKDIDVDRITIAKQIETDVVYLYTFRDCNTDEYITIIGNDQTKLYDGRKYIRLCKLQIGEYVNVNYKDYNIVRHLMLVDVLPIRTRTKLYVFESDKPILFEHNVIIDGPTRNSPLVAVRWDLVEIADGLKILLPVKVIDLLESVSGPC